MSTSRIFGAISLVAAFFVFGFAVYHAAFTAPMLYDSALLIKENEHVFERGLLETLRVFPQRPVSMVTFYINYVAGGMDPSHFRVVNVFLMACTASAVALALVLILETPGATAHGTSMQRRFVCVALGSVFLVHPVAVYVVEYIWQRSALLAALFSFLSLAAYVATRMGRISNSVAGYAACAMLFLLGLASKETAIALPAVLLVAEWVLFKTDLRSMLGRSLVIGLVVVAAVGVMTFLEHPHGKTALKAGVLHTIEQYYLESGLTLSQVVMAQCMVFFEYLKMLLWPFPSHVYFIKPQVVASSITDPPAAAAAVAGVIAITAFAGLYLVRMRPLAGFGVLFFFISQLPEALLVPQFMFFGYRALVPMFGLLLIAADGMLTLIDLPKTGNAKLAMKVALGVATVAVLALLGYATSVKASIWMDPVVFWQDSLRAFPRDETRVEKRAAIHIWNSLANYLRAAGAIEDAVVMYRKSMKRDPQDSYAHLALAEMFVQAGRTGDAEAVYEELVAIEHDNVAAHVGLGRLMAKQQRLGRASEHFAKAVELEPGQPEINYGMARVLVLTKDYRAAVPFLKRTLELSSEHVGALYNLALIRMNEGNTAEASDHLKKAVAADPSFWTGFHHLGTLAVQAGNLNDAAEYFRKALEINPDAEQVRMNLDKLQETLNAQRGRGAGSE